MADFYILDKLPVDMILAASSCSTSTSSQIINTGFTIVTRKLPPGLFGIRFIGKYSHKLKDLEDQYELDCKQNKRSVPACQEATLNLRYTVLSPDPFSRTMEEIEFARRDEIERHNFRASRGGADCRRARRTQKARKGRRGWRASTQVTRKRYGRSGQQPGQYSGLMASP